MDELDREYTLLFNGITDTIRELEGQIRFLKKLQVAAEEEYLRRRCGNGRPRDGENVVKLDAESFSVME